VKWDRWPWTRDEIRLVARLNDKDGPEFFNVDLDTIRAYQEIGIPLVIESTKDRVYLQVRDYGGRDRGTSKNVTRNPKGRNVFRFALGRRRNEARNVVGASNPAKGRG
jgi:hypothetical protein